MRSLQISSLPAAVEITLSSNLVWLDEETETHSGLSLCRHKAVRGSPVRWGVFINNLTHILIYFHSECLISFKELNIANKYGILYVL